MSYADILRQAIPAIKDNRKAITEMLYKLIEQKSKVNLLTTEPKEIEEAKYEVKLLEEIRYALDKLYDHIGNDAAIIMKVISRAREEVLTFNDHIQVLIDNGRPIPSSSCSDYNKALDKLRLVDKYLLVEPDKQQV